MSYFLYNLLFLQNEDEETCSSTRSSREKAKKDLFKQTSPDSSSDSDFDDQDSSYGPTTRKAWSDFCSVKGKSSQSEDDAPSKVSMIIGVMCFWVLVFIF